MSKAKVNIGDLVRLNESVMPIRRVGYALVWYEVDDADLFRYYDEEGQHGLKALMSNMSLMAQYEFKDGLAKAYVRDHNFGGPERTVHRSTEGCLVLPPGIYRVNNKRFCKTGTRRTAGGYEFDPPVNYLCPEHTHCIVCLDPVDVHADAVYHNTGEVLLSDCEVMK